MKTKKKKRDYHAEWLRLKARLKVRYAWLVLRLGGKCRHCGTNQNLQLDHPNGKTWEARKLSPQMRMKRYEEDYENGQLDLLCATCNARDGALNKDFYGAVQRGEEVPF